MHQYIRIYALLALLAVTLPATAQAEDNGMTARGIFTLLPASIFENTAEGLSDAEKQQILGSRRRDRRRDCFRGPALPGQRRSPATLP